MLLLIVVCITTHGYGAFFVDSKNVNGVEVTSKLATFFLGSRLQFFISDVFFYNIYSRSATSSSFFFFFHILQCLEFIFSQNK